MKNKIVFADFETFKNEDGNPEVVAWGVYNKDFYYYGINIESFLEWIKTLKKKYYIYFHNGAKFDMKFVIPKLIKAGFIDKFKSNKKAIQSIFTKKVDYKEERILEGLLQEMEFTYLTDQSFKIYTLELVINGVKLEFLDSNLIFPNQLKEYGNMLNQFYKTDKFTKGEEDYSKLHRWESLEAFENSGNSFNYLKQDCIIGYEFLIMIEQYLKFNYWKITLGSTTINDWARSFCVDFVKNSPFWTSYIPSKSNGSFVMWKNIKKPKVLMKEKRVIREVLNEWFPVSWQDNFLQIKTWFKGGLTHINPIYRGIVLEKELVFNKADINSSYPASLYNTLIPYGKPSNKKKKGYNWSLLEITAISDLHNEFGLPFIPTENGTHYTYDKIIPAGRVINICSTELPNFQKYYIGEYKIKHVLYFQSKKGSFFFGNFIDKWMALKITAKKENNKGLEYFAKLMLNALYGKFGTKNIRKAKILNYELKILEEEIVHNRYKFYLPVAIATTAASRQLLVDAVGMNYKHFVYCDTDSIVGISKHWNKFNIQLDNNELGKWKLEKENWEGIFRGAKQYAEWKEDKLIITFAGLKIPEDYNFNLEKFIYGDKLIQKRPKRVLMEGLLIEDYVKEIKPLWSEKGESWFNADTIKQRQINYEDKYNEQLEKLKNLS